MIETSYLKGMDFDVKEDIIESYLLGLNAPPKK